MSTTAIFAEEVDLEVTPERMAIFDELSKANIPFMIGWAIGYIVAQPKLNESGKLLERLIGTILHGKTTEWLSEFYNAWLILSKCSRNDCLVVMEVSTLALVTGKETPIPLLPPSVKPLVIPGLDSAQQFGSISPN